MMKKKVYIIGIELFFFFQNKLLFFRFTKINQGDF